MCTVVYLPLKDRVIFSSSRDENPNRQRALTPSINTINGIDLLYPADGEAGGTWIGINSNGSFAVIMNGGFTNHRKADQYRISRGIIVKEMLASKNGVIYWQQTDLYNIEPFTIILYSGKKIYRLVWTGNEKHIDKPDISLPHIWSSATLYDENAKTKREGWFADYVAATLNFSCKNLLHFLQQKHEDDLHNDFIINRNEIVKTCSISIVEISQPNASFQYVDLLTNQNNTSTIFFKPNQDFTAEML